ncbi:unnamed protein product [Closterium sp. Naga37s-1]|nr:unnamed protein product [Closterium sp. Naga37s-1]
MPAAAYGGATSSLSTSPTPDQADGLSYVSPAGIDVTGTRSDPSSISNFSRTSTGPPLSRTSTGPPLSRTSTGPPLSRVSSGGLSSNSWTGVAPWDWPESLAPAFVAGAAGGGGAAWGAAGGGGGAWGGAGSGGGAWGASGAAVNGSRVGAGEGRAAAGGTAGEGLGQQQGGLQGNSALGMHAGSGYGGSAAGGLGGWGGPGVYSGGGAAAGAVGAVEAGAVAAGGGGIGIGIEAGGLGRHSFLAASSTSPPTFTRSLTEPRLFAPRQAPWHAPALSPFPASAFPPPPPSAYSPPPPSAFPPGFPLPSADPLSPLGAGAELLSPTRPLPVCPAKGQWVRGSQIGAGGFGRVFQCVSSMTGEVFAVKQVALDRSDRSELSQTSQLLAPTSFPRPAPPCAPPCACMPPHCSSMTGEVFAVKQVALDRSDADFRGDHSIEQLKQEIMLLSRINHPNIVQYLGCEIDDKYLYIFLEYMEMGSILNVLKKLPVRPHALLSKYVRQVLQGLAFLHSMEFVHRDIKCSNILVDKSGTIKLADFGLAKHYSASLDMTGCRGTVWWMAPEVINASGGYDWAVDIWSLGCTVIEMVTLWPPWFHPASGCPIWGRGFGPVSAHALAIINPANRTSGSTEPSGACKCPTCPTCPTRSGRPGSTPPPAAPSGAVASAL